MGNQAVLKREFVSSIEVEYRRYKTLGEGAIAQIEDEHLGAVRSGFDNSIAAIVWHLSGNLRSRFTDFLTTDGEKPWRDRESEFKPRDVAKGELLLKWEEGWQSLFDALATLTDEDLNRTVSIRAVPLSVHEALHRSLAHASYHVGQIVYVSKSLRGTAWTFLSIPPRS